MLTKSQFFYDHTTKQALGFQNPFYLKKAQQLEPKLYDGNVIKSTSAIVIPDSEETLMLAKESRSKMLLKQQDPMVLEKKVNTTPVDYAVLNQLSQDFEKQFVPQTELSAEQAFWSQNSMNSSDPSPSCRPTKVEVPKELPKVSMVNTSLKKLKHHLAGFDVVVKERTTTTTITKGPDNSVSNQSAPNFDHYFELNELKAQSQEKDTVIRKIFGHYSLKRMTLRKLKGRDLADNVVTKHTIDPEMLKVDIEPIAPKLLNNRTAHSDYLRHTQEQAAILRECNGCMLFDNHDLCVLNFINDVNARVKSKSVKKSSKRNVWKPTGKVFIKIGYTWRPTGSQYIYGSLVSDVPSTFLLNGLSKICSMYLDFLAAQSIRTGLGHNLFFVGKFYDSNLEVAFRQHTCFIRNLKGVDLLTGSRGNNLYTLSLGDMMASSPICQCTRAQRLCSGYGTDIYSLSKLWLQSTIYVGHGLVRGLPKLKFEKDHLCSVCAIGKSKKKPQPKSEGDTIPRKHAYSLAHGSLLWKTEFVNQTLREYYEKVGISHETSVARFPQQNGVVERRNRTLIEAARTMLIYAKALLFLWAEAVATAYFDELTPMASKHSSLESALHEMTHTIISSGLVPNHPPSTPFVPPSRTDWDILFQPLFDELLNPPSSVDRPAPEVIAPIAEVVAPEPAASTGSPSSTTVDQDAPSPSNSQTTPETQSLIISNDVEEENHDLDVAHMNNDPFFGILILENDSEASSSSDVIPTIVHTAAPNSEHVTKWTKDHPLDNIIGELERPVSTRLQLHEQALFCYYDAFLTSVEPKNYKDALTQACWIEAMQEELNEFEYLIDIDHPKLIRGISESLTQNRQDTNKEPRSQWTTPTLLWRSISRLEEEKARRHGKVYNWETATYAALSCEPMISSLNDEIDFRISFNESDDEDCT
ncbi:retrovirus-related pol polyprotein from transposon TNT 1-94, partial [Tanacetum coccineum]